MDENKIAEKTRYLERMIFEDDLPDDITDEEYTEWYANSFIPDGVGCRIGLATKAINNKDNNRRSKKMSKITKEAAERGIVKVPVCKTTDGSIFEDNESALEHQREIDFDEWYQENEFRITNELEDGEKLMRDWLTENKDEILRFLGI